jgi:uncharacterized protein with HEPN domain
VVSSHEISRSRPKPSVCDPSDAERIADITEAAHQVAELVARGRGALDHDLAVRLAIERLLEIIGEAASRLTDEARAARRSVPWREIARLRIVLAHHYHRVDPDQVWQIASVDVPMLLNELESPKE